MGRYVWRDQVGRRKHEFLVWESRCDPGKSKRELILWVTLERNFRSDDLEVTLCGALVIFGVVIKTPWNQRAICPQGGTTLEKVYPTNPLGKHYIISILPMRKLAQRSCGTIPGLYSEEAIKVEFELRMIYLQGQHSAPQALGWPILSEGQTTQVCALSVAAQIPVTSE